MNLPSLARVALLAGTMSLVIPCSCGSPHGARADKPETRRQRFLREKLQELDSFKSKPEFHRSGFAQSRPFYPWLSSVESKRDAPDFTSDERVAVADLQGLGLQYVYTKGKENDYTKFAREQIQAVLNGTYKESFQPMNAGGFEGFENSVKAMPETEKHPTSTTETKERSHRYSPDAIRNHPIVARALASLRELQIVSLSTESSSFENLCAEAKFAVDVFLERSRCWESYQFVESSPIEAIKALQVNKACSARVNVKLALIHYEFFAAGLRDKSKGVSVIPEDEIYDYLVQHPSLREHGKPNSLTGRLEFQIDDVLESFQTTANMYLVKAEVGLNTIGSSVDLELSQEFP